MSCLRVVFNIGPSYQLEAATPSGPAAMSFRHHGLMIIPPDTPVSHHSTTPRMPGRPLKPAYLASFRISRELVADSAIALGLPPQHGRLAHQIVPSDEVLRLLAQALYTDLLEGSPDGARASERLAMALVTRLLLRGQARAAGPARLGLDRARAHIDAHLSEPLHLEELAAIAGMSLFHFCRVFRQSLGVTPHQYILSRRIELARRLLWASRIDDAGATNMLDIALACGFNSASHFAAQFRRHTGLTPRQWVRDPAALDGPDDAPGVPDGAP